MLDRGERIGKMVVNMGLVKAAHVNEAIELCKTNGRSFGQNLVTLGYVADASLMQLIVAQGAASPWNFEGTPPDSKTLRLVSASVMREHLLVPVCRIGDLLTIAMKDTHDHAAQERVRSLTGLRVECVEADEQQIKGLIEFVINGGRKEKPAPVQEQRAEQQTPAEPEKVTIECDVVSTDDTAPVAGLVEQIIADSVRREASEILIESNGSGLSIRFRIDGRLRSIGDVPKSVMNLVVARFRMLASLDVLDLKEPQQGVLRHKTVSKDIAFDVNFVPTAQGQRILLRKSNSSVSAKSLAENGVARNEIELINRALADGQGLLLVAAPTSMLRTKTIYALLREIASPEREIITVEESCGVPISGVSHTIVAPFEKRAKAQRIEHLMRGSSDVLVVEGLEQESAANLTVRAALAGRLVVAGIEAKSALDAIERLNELGVDRRFIAASLVGVLGVRQVRTLCRSCSKEQNDLRVSVGCTDCDSTGYKGTVDLFEFLPVSEDVSRLIAQHAHSADVEREAMKAGLRPIAEYAISRIERGETDVKEVEQTFNCKLPGDIKLEKSSRPVVQAAKEVVAVRGADGDEDFEKELERERRQMQAHFSQESFQVDLDRPSSF